MSHTSSIQNLVELLPHTNDTAIITPNNQSISFMDLRNKIGNFAGGLQQLGVKPGARVVILVPMSIELYVALLATLWIDATVMLIDPSAPLDSILPRFQPDVFIASGKAHLLRLRYASLRACTLQIATSWTILPHKRLHNIQATPPPINTPQHPALLTFTTGTTGVPKAMARSHSFLLCQHHALKHHMNYTAKHVDLPTLPVFLLHSLAAGATCVLPNANLQRVDSVDPTLILAQITQHNIHSMSGSPAFFLPFIEKYATNTISGVRQIFTGGARVNAKIATGLCATFPDAEIYIVYGSTEAEPIAVCHVNSNLSLLCEGESKGIGALVGRPVPEIQIWIRDQEIVVTGNHVNQSYYQDSKSDAENKIHHEGTIWHRTGDAGFMDDDGNLWLLGRMGDAVQGIWPVTIESRAECVDFVRKAAFVEHRGAGLLVLELEKGHNPKTLSPTDKQTIANIFPNTRFVAQIPVDPRHNSKIDRKQLQKILEKNEHEPELRVHK